MLNYVANFDKYCIDFPSVCKSPSLRALESTLSSFRLLSSYFGCVFHPLQVRFEVVFQNKVYYTLSSIKLAMKACLPYVDTFDNVGFRLSRPFIRFVEPYYVIKLYVNIIKFK